MDQLGGPRDHHPRKSFWARFSEQETGPQKVLVGLAGTMTALATTHRRDLRPHQRRARRPADGRERPDRHPAADRDSRASPARPGIAEPTPTATATQRPGLTLKPGQTLVTQGSKEADALVHAFVDEPGAARRARRRDPAGARDTGAAVDHAALVQLPGPARGPAAGRGPVRQRDSSPSTRPTRPARLFKRPLRIELQAASGPTPGRPGQGYGAAGLEIFPAPASF